MQRLYPGEDNTYVIHTVWIAAHSPALLLSAARGCSNTVWPLTFTAAEHGHAGRLGDGNLPSCFSTGQLPTTRFMLDMYTFSYVSFPSPSAENACMPIFGVSERFQMNGASRSLSETQASGCVTDLRPSQRFRAGRWTEQVKINHLWSLVGDTFCFSFSFCVCHPALDSSPPSHHASRGRVMQLMAWRQMLTLTHCLINDHVWIQDPFFFFFFFF